MSSTEFINYWFTSLGKVSWFYLVVTNLLSSMHLILIISPQNLINHLIASFEPNLGSMRGKESQFLFHLAF